MTEGRSKALFLDRDGVINVERGYVHRRECFEFIPGIFELCSAAQQKGYLLVVATNQAGIARGYYSESDFNELTSWMTGRFAEKERSYYARLLLPIPSSFRQGQYKCDSPDRKPNPGMLLRAQSDLDLDLAIEHSHRRQTLRHSSWIARQALALRSYCRPKTAKLTHKMPRATSVLPWTISGRKFFSAANCRSSRRTKLKSLPKPPLI